MDDPRRFGNWIQTRTGRFWPLDPRAEEVSLADIAAALSKQCRFGGHCRKFMSVAEHCCRGADHLLEMVPDYPLYALGFLLHDASEAYLVDLPQPVKMMFPMFGQAEAGIQAAVLQAFDLPADLFDRGALKQTDLLMLSTERAHLMDHMEWGAILPDPLPDPPRCLTPAEAEVLYLSRFDELMRRHLAVEPRERYFATGVDGSPPAACVPT